MLSKVLVLSMHFKSTNVFLYIEVPTYNMFNVQVGLYQVGLDSVCAALHVVVDGGPLVEHLTCYHGDQQRQDETGTQQPRSSRHFHVHVYILFNKILFYIATLLRIRISEIEGCLHIRSSAKY